MSDPLLDIADALVTALTEAFEDDATVAFGEDALVELSDEDLLEPHVMVVDASAGLIHDHGLAMEEYGLLIVVQRKLAADSVRSTVLRAMADLSWQVARFCRSAVLEGAVCVKAVRQPARDLADYHALDRYYCEIQTVWRRPDEG